MNTELLAQEQFLDVIDRDEAERRFHAVLDLHPLEPETINLRAARGRVLAEDIIAPINVPGFDRSNVDGFAVRAADTFGATELVPRILRPNPETISPGRLPTVLLNAGTATAIATGAVIPRGADAVLMIEHTDFEKNNLPALKHDSYPSSVILVRRAVSPSANITFAGTDIGQGEMVLRRGETLTARETGVLAALGMESIPVFRRPRVAIISTGDELRAPGQTLEPGQIYDSNSVILADAVTELGGEPLQFGIIADDFEHLAQTLQKALNCDIVLLSGGTSKGAGDIAYRVVADIAKPGIVVHGVALKPGKPLCLAAAQLPGRRTVPIVVLPGFPTSAIFTFRAFVAPLIRRLNGYQDPPEHTIQAVVPHRVHSEKGRTEFMLVGLVDGPELAAYPMGKGSGSVTAFGRADGYFIIPRHVEIVDAGERVEVHLLDRELRPADLVVIGSHCVGLDWLLSRLQERGFRSKFLAVGSTAGLHAAQRGECDLAGIHLLHEHTDIYNAPFVTDDLLLVRGYGRLQGIIHRPDDNRFAGRSATSAILAASTDAACVMVNRNRGSGTRVLIDQLLNGKQPPGYWNEARSHNAVAAAVAQRRADWGVAISPLAKELAFIPLRHEQFDFVIPKSRAARQAARAFVELLTDSQTRLNLKNLGFFTEVSPNT